MTDDAAIAKLNALVGAALKGLVDSGASFEAIGAFAASYRTQASQLLGISDAPPEAPDLEAIVTNTVTKALRDLNLVKDPEARKGRVYLKIGGVRTSVTISEKSMARLEKERGEKEANKFIEQLAGNAPKDIKNRSKWVESRLAALWQSVEHESTASQARH